MSGSASGLGRSQRFARAADLSVLVAALLLTAFLLLILLSFRYGRDQGIYAVVADAVTRGGAPYKDAWDFKPPMIFFFYAAARSAFGSGMEAIRLLEAAALVSLLPAFCILSRRHLADWRPGVVAGAVAVLAHVQLEYWDTAQPESFGGVATAWALVCATYGPRQGDLRGRRRQRLAWSGAGLLYGLCAVLKPHLGGGLLVSLGFVIAESLRRDRSAAGQAVLEPVVAFTAGALGVLVATIGYFAALDAWGDLHEALFVFAPHYHALRFEAGELPAYHFRAVKDSLFGFTAYLPVGILLLLALPRVAPRERRGIAHVAAVAAVQVSGIALQARFYPYHYGATLPLCSLLAGWGIWKLWSRLHAKPLYAVSAFAALAYLGRLDPGLVSYGPMTFWQRCGSRLEVISGRGAASLVDRLHSVVDVHHGANRRVAEWLRESTPADASVYIWGFEPMIYEMAGRRPASAYVYNLPQRLDWPGRERARQRLIAELESDPPAAIVVVEGDVRQAITGNRLDSRDELAGFPALRGLLASSYEPARRIEDLVVHRRRR